MARRKRLNKRFVVLLASVGTLLVLLAVTAIIAIQPLDADKLAQRAKKHLEEGKYAEAVHNYLLAAQESHKPEYYLALGDAQLQWLENDHSLGQSQRGKLFGEALGAFREAVRWKRDYVEAQRKLTELEFDRARALRNWQDYITEVNKLLQLVPDDHEVLFMRARAKAQMADTRPEYIEPALEDHRKLLGLAPQVEEYWLSLAALYARRDRKADAEKTYRDALQAIPDSVGVRVAYSNYIRQDKAREAEAKNLLTDAIAKQPENAEGYVAMANYHLRQMEVDQARQILQKALLVDPADHRTYAMLAYLHSAQRNALPEAEAILVKGLDALRKPLDEAPGRLPREELARYERGILTLNHLFCDVLLDQLRRGGSREDLLPRVNKALREMQGISREHPFIHKIVGELALADGRYVEAERLLRKAYEGFSPGFNTKTARLLIHIYRRLNQLGEAQKIIERYLSLSKGSPSLLLDLVGLYIDYREYDQAQRVVQDVLKLEPDHELAKSLSIALEAATGKRDRIPPELGKLDRHTAGLFLQRARELWSEGEEEKAVRLAVELVTKDARNASATFQLIQWLKERKQTAQVGALLGRAMAAFKDDPDMQKRLAWLRETDPAKRMQHELTMTEKIADPVRQAVTKADIYRRYEKEEESLAQLKAAEAKDPKNGMVVRRMFDHALRKSDWAAAERWAKVAAETDLDTVGGKIFQARLAHARRDWDGALRLIGEALKLRSRFSEAYSFRGDCFLALEKLDEARADYETAHKQNPSNVKALLGMVFVSEKTGTQAEYARWVRLAYRFLPTDPRIRERIVRLREVDEEPAKVIKQREKIRKSEPNNLQNLLRLAALYEKTEKLHNAEEAYRAIYRISKRAPWAVRALARFLGRTNRDVKARGLLAQYAKSAQDKAPAYLVWAEYLEFTGELEQARAVYKKAAEADRDGQGYVGIARFFERLAEFAEAANYQQKFLARFGQAAEPRHVRALILYQVEAGQYEQAQQRIAKLLGANPADHEALTLKALAYFRQKDFDKTKQTVDKALDINPQSAGALRLRAQYFLVTGQQSLAARDAQAAMRIGSRTSPRDALGLVQIYDSMEDFGNAHAVLQGLLSERPDYAPALRAGVVLCLKHKRWGLMEQALAEGQKTHPKDPFYPEKEAEMWRFRGQPARAVAAMRAALKIAPREAEARLSIRLAQVHTEAGQYAQALQVCRDLRSRKVLPALAMAIEGRVHAKQGNQAEAEKWFTAALKTAPSEQLPSAIGQVQAAYPSTAAIANLKRWAELRPEEWVLPYSLGEMMAKKQDHHGAVEQYQKALTMASTDVEKWRNYRQLGTSYQRLGRYPEGRQAYEAALKFDPNDGATLNNLAWLIALHLNNPNEALPYIERAAKLMPGNPYMLDTYGFVLLLKGDLHKAEEVLNRSIHIRAIPANRLHLGNVYEKMGNKEDALRQYRLGWELIKDKPKEPHYDELRDAVRRIQGAP